MSEDILKLTTKQFFDYIECPKLFYTKYVSKIPVFENQSLNSLVNKVVKIYFVNLFDGKILKMPELKDEWDKVCKQYKSQIKETTITDGIMHLYNLTRWAETNMPIICDINTGYTLVFGNTILVGNLGAIRCKDNKLELLVVEANRTSPNQDLVDQSMKYTLDIYAFNKIYKQKLSFIRVLFTKNNKEIITYRTKKDFDRLKETINGVSKGIRNEIFYPRESFTCPSCLSKNYCLF